MHDCCKNITTQLASLCPECNSEGMSVKIRTLFHQIRFPDNQEISQDNYFYCPSSICQTTYYSETGKSISQSRLVNQQALKDKTLCYCFAIKCSQYKLALQTNTADTIKNFVIQHTKLANCACEVRNPSGQCCLIHFKQIEKEHATDD